MAAAAASAELRRRRRTALVLGVSNGRSLGWACAGCLLSEGYDVVVTYQNERFRSKVETLVRARNAESAAAAAAADASPAGGRLRVPPPPPVIRSLPCDVSSDESIDSLFRNDLPEALREERSDGTPEPPPRRLDALVHSIAYAPPDAMKDGTLLTTSRESFDVAHRISAYSLIAVARAALPLMSFPDDESSTRRRNSPSITTLTYEGSTRAVPNYNVMGPAKASLESIVRGLALELGRRKPYGIRVNAVSVGPVNTLAGRGIRGFGEMRSDCERRSPLGRNVTAEEAGKMVAFLAGEGGSGVTGQTLYVDGGCSVVAGPVGSDAV